MSNATVSAPKPAAGTGYSYDDIDHSEPTGHGNSPAAWTTRLRDAGRRPHRCPSPSSSPTPRSSSRAASVMVLGLVVGFVMRKAGYGVGGSKLKNSGH